MIYLGKINFQIHKFGKDNTIPIEGIVFRNSIMIKVEISGIPKIISDIVLDGLVVLPELYKSLNQDGKFLILTSINGIADDGGWSKILVEHKLESIVWHMDINFEMLEILFSEHEYKQKIETLKHDLEKLTDNMIIEPQYLIYPEG